MNASATRDGGTAPGFPCHLPIPARDGMTVLPNVPRPASEGGR